MNEVSTRIRKIIEESQQSYTELEHKTGIKKSTLQRYASGTTTKIPLDAVEKIALAFNVHPATLMGWDEDNEFSRKYRKKLAEIMQTADAADIQNSGIDTERIHQVIDGDLTLTLDLACAIADEMGMSLDELFGRPPTERIKAALKNEDSLTAEIIELLLSLPEQKRQEALNYLRYLSKTSDNQ